MRRCPQSVNEEWRPIAGYQDRYEVSNRGRVRNSRTGLVRKTFLAGSQAQRSGPRFREGDGYPYIDLWKHNEREKFAVHRLVAFAFVGQPPTDLHEVNHMDGDKKNNVASNLEWVTKSENSLHAHYVIHTGYVPGGAKGEDHPQSKLTDAGVREIRRRLRNGEFQRVLAKDFGVTQLNISAISTRKTWTHVK